MANQCKQQSRGVPQHGEIIAPMVRSLPRRLTLACSFRGFPAFHVTGQRCRTTSSQQSTMLLLADSDSEPHVEPHTCGARVGPV